MSNKRLANEKLDRDYKLYYANLQRFCMLKLKNQDQTEDCVQESFYILYKHYLKNEDIKNVSGFLYKIADNLIKAQWRENKKQENVVQLETVADALITEDITDYSDFDYDLLAEKLVSEFNVNEQEIYKLKYIENKTIKEIGEELNLSFDVVAKRLSRLRQKVKEIIKIQFEGGD